MLMVLLLAFGMMACGTPQNQPDDTEAASDTLDSITEILTGDERFQTLVTALDSAGLMPTLREEGPYTVFAPTDQALEQLPDGTMEELLQPSNRDRLVEILTYHLVDDAHMQADLQEMSSTMTLEGRELSIRAEGGAVIVGEATVVEPDLEADNGVVHVIDAVLRPPEDEDSM